MKQFIRNLLASLKAFFTSQKEEKEKEVITMPAVIRRRRKLDCQLDVHQKAKQMEADLIVSSDQIDWDQVRLAKAEAKRQRKLLRNKVTL